MKVDIKNHQRKIKIKLERLKVQSLRLLRAFRLQEAELGILLVNDNCIKKLNNQYRNINRTTDVLSFAMYEKAKLIPADREAQLGDIIINLHAAKRQAAIYGNTFNGEVSRLLLHGFLHLLGYDHEKNSYQKRKMEKKELELLNALKDLD